MSARENQQMKTYSHLSNYRRMPSEYEIVTGKLLYYVDKGIELKLPIADWYEKYQKSSCVYLKDWESFYDPHEYTYTSYIDEQSKREIYIREILSSINDSQNDFLLNDNWIEKLNLVLPPSRFLFHGLQMVISYVASMAPSGRLVIMCMLQAVNEMKRIQYMAYRMRQLQAVKQDFGTNAKDLWMRHEFWQPWRQCTELLLVEKDWFKALIALNSVFKPIVDEMFIYKLSAECMTNEDNKFSEILTFLSYEHVWQKAWTERLMRFVVAEHPLYQDTIEQIQELWRKKAESIQTY